ncbi:hypothetical protein [Halopseudomonas sp.]|uniref:hypothetical protein n=1 Tax=Halopseudomonas sp. TaxID=2901191 RepID=UPI00356498EE
MLKHTSRLLILAFSILMSLMLVDLNGGHIPEITAAGVPANSGIDRPGQGSSGQQGKQQV